MNIIQCAKCTRSKGSREFANLQNENPSLINLIYFSFWLSCTFFADMIAVPFPGKFFIRSGSSAYSAIMTTSFLFHNLMENAHPQMCAGVFSAHLLQGDVMRFYFLTETTNSFGRGQNTHSSYGSILSKNLSYLIANSRQYSSSI